MWGDSKNVIETKTEICETHGEYQATAIHTSKRFGVTWSWCPECEAAREKSFKAAEEERKVQLKKEHLRAACIPLRFQDKGLSNYHPADPGQKRALELAQNYAAQFDEHLKVGRSLILTGKVGTGKTHIATGILKAIVDASFSQQETLENNSWHPVRYTTASEIIRTIRETWSTHASETEALQKFVRPHLLVIDEVGLQFGSESERTQLGELIDMRYQKVLPTLLITNCEKSQLAQFIGERAVDRLRENGGLMAVFDWESHRGTMRLYSVA